MKKLQQSEKDLMNKQSAVREKRSTEEKIIPTTQRILDSYDQLTATEKNELWKMVMEKITAYRTPEGEFRIHIYPKLPSNTVKRYYTRITKIDLSTYAPFCAMIITM